MIKNILIAILIIASINAYAQSVEVITKERAKKIVDSLKTISGQSFKHVLKKPMYYENNENYRNYFLTCVNYISRGFLIPYAIQDENGEIVEDGIEYIIQWYGKLEDSGEPHWREKPETSLNDKIWIYYNIPSIGDYYDYTEDVYIGYICSPAMCTKRDDGK
jgi:hypothetical protein